MITMFVSFHHFKEPDKVIKEIMRISRPGTLLIIREHDASQEIQPYLDFVHLIETIKDYGKNSLKFLYTYHAGYFSSIGLQSSFENIGCQSLASVVYPKILSKQPKFNS